MNTPKILTLRNENECKCIDLADLIYVCVEDYLSTFHYANNQKFTCTKSLLEVESILPDNFFRINRNLIVNINNINTILYHNRTIILSDSTRLIVAYRRIRQLQITLTRRNVALAG